MVKQKQKNSPTQVPTKELKTKNRAEAKDDTKVPRYEVGSGEAHKTLPQVALETFPGIHLPTSLVALIKTGGLFKGKDLLCTQTNVPRFVLLKSV